MLMSENVRLKWDVSGKTTLSMDLELIFTLENIHLKSVICGKSNSMHASVHTLSLISTKESSQTVNGPVSINPLYSLNSRATFVHDMMQALW